MWSALRGHTLNKRFHKWLHWVYAKCNFGSQTVQINPWPTKQLLSTTGERPPRGTGVGRWKKQNKDKTKLKPQHRELIVALQLWLINKKIQSLVRNLAHPIRYLPKMPKCSTYPRTTLSSLYTQCCGISIGHETVLSSHH